MWSQAEHELERASFPDRTHVVSGCAMELFGLETVLAAQELEEMDFGPLEFENGCIMMVVKVPIMAAELLWGMDNAALCAQLLGIGCVAFQAFDDFLPPICSAGTPNSQPARRADCSFSDRLGPSPSNADGGGEQAKILRELRDFAARRAPSAAPASSTTVRVAVYVDDDREATKQLVQAYNVQLQLTLLRALRSASAEAFEEQHPVRHVFGTEPSTVASSLFFGLLSL
jgi:hypothetical protein